MRTVDEEIHGRSPILRGAVMVLDDVAYSLVLSHTDLPGGVRGLNRVTGSIDVDASTGALLIAGVGPNTEPLTLVLTDRRRLNFYLKSSGGTISRADGGDIRRNGPIGEQVGR